MASFGSFASRVGSATKTGAKNISRGMGMPSSGGRSGINTGPSQGFMSRMGNAVPGAINTMAQNYGNPSMRGGVQQAGNAFGMMPRRPIPQSPNMTMPPLSGGMFPQAEPVGIQIPNTDGMVQGPRQIDLTNMFGPGRNTGIAGGMGGYGMQMPPQKGGLQAGPLFQNYRRMLM